MVSALTMKDLSKTIIKKEIDLVAYVDTSTITEASNEKPDDDVADNPTMIYRGVTLMTKSKRMTKAGMHSMTKDLIIGMDFMDKGVSLWTKA